MQRTDRTLVVGDIHGAQRALMQALERAAFDRDRDRLIVIGDVADGWPDVPQCIDFILGTNYVALLGNHDEWFRQWALSDEVPDFWLPQGGRATYLAYGGLAENVPDAHLAYLTNARDFLIDGEQCFVHAGLSLDPECSPEETDPHLLRWSRDFWRAAVAMEAAADDEPHKLSAYDEVFLGHTPTHRNWPECKPVRACNVWNVDQGAGWDGKLTVLDVVTKEFWQSDPVASLYPGVQGR